MKRAGKGPDDRTMLSVMQIRAGGCGGCALEIEAVSLREAGLSLTQHPGHADILLVSGAAGPEMRRAVEAAWAGMAEPKQLVLVGDCAIGGGPFAGGYAGIEGFGLRLPAVLAVPGSPPHPAEILAALRSLTAAAVSTAPPATERASPPPAGEADRPAPLPAAPRHRLGDDGSSGS
ncbi:hypothetical protein NFI95_09795 [Acetobacteraceae bacterium KSS8]|uniref:NADH:ubiquinone oxidoreductase-like 20kDa subunit domain-containing protein n=1 Tax=Endosaccharibacter trunci TaxID=2812733 RepID=A0ABT1W788_9PROT|nr:hypothetical protein [Acetobacteraceae bacterium KSS8]